MEYDIERLLAAFEACGSLTFPAFKAVWAEVDFSALHAEIHDPADIDGTAMIYQDFFATILSYFGRPVHLRWKIGAMYTLYLMYSTQPLTTPVPIRIGPYEWSRMRAAVEACAPLSSICDAQQVFRILFAGGAFVFASYSGSENYASIARAARLYGLHDMFVARGPAYPLIDHVAEVFYPDVTSLSRGPSFALSSPVEDGPKAKLLQDKRRRAARRSSTGGVGTKRSRGSDAYLGGAVMASVGAATKANLFSNIQTPRDSETRLRSREVGDLILTTLGLRRPPVNALATSGTARLWFDGAFSAGDAATNLQKLDASGERRVLVDFQKTFQPSSAGDAADEGGPRNRKRRRSKKHDDAGMEAVDLGYLDPTAFDNSYVAETHDVVSASEVRQVIATFLSSIPRSKLVPPPAVSADRVSGGLLHRTTLRTMPIATGPQVGTIGPDGVLSALQDETSSLVTDSNWWTDDYARFDQTETLGADYDEAAARLQRLALEMMSSAHDAAVTDTIVGEEGV